MVSVNYFNIDSTEATVTKQPEQSVVNHLNHLLILVSGSEDFFSALCTRAAQVLHLHRDWVGPQSTS